MARHLTRRAVTHLLAAPIMVAVLGAASPVRANEQLPWGREASEPRVITPDSNVNGNGATRYYPPAAETRRGYNQAPRYGNDATRKGPVPDNYSAGRSYSQNQTGNPPPEPYPAPNESARRSGDPYGNDPYGNDPYGNAPNGGADPYGADRYGNNPNRAPNGGSRTYSSTPYNPSRPYEPNDPPRARDRGTYSSDEIKAAGHRFFGKVSGGLAKVIEYAFQKAGRPTGYILGEEAGGAFIAGLRYGEGTLRIKGGGSQRVYWQGPSIGYDFGAEGSKTMILVYNLYNPSDIYNVFAGVDGSAYLVGGVGITFQARNEIKLAPIRSGVGLRLGANVGYLRYTRAPTWLPF